MPHHQADATPPSQYFPRFARRLALLSPNQLLAILAVLIFIAEICDMLLLGHLPELPLWGEALLDSCLLLIMLSPAYLFLYRPFWVERQRASEEIRRLSRQLIRAEEATRKTLARDLHDEFGQLLSALQMGIETLHNSLPAKDDRLAAQCRRLSGITAQLGSHVRDVTARLRPTILDNLGLVAALHWHLRQFELDHPDMQIIMDVPEEEMALSGEATLALYRVFQESLTNVTRHAHATQVRISLQRQNGQVAFLIEDNGVGFNPEGGDSRSAVRHTGFGIAGMRERIADLHGSLTIFSQPGEGTVVLAELQADDEEPV